MEEDNMCAFCLANMTDNTTTVACGHIFHTVCYTKYEKVCDNAWMNCACPLCKTVLRQRVMPVFMLLEEDDDAQRIFRDDEDGEPHTDREEPRNHQDEEPHNDDPCAIFDC
jgi:hypothetical protein